MKIIIIINNNNNNDNNNNNIDAKEIHFFISLWLKKVALHGDCWNYFSGSTIKKGLLKINQSINNKSVNSLIQLIALHRGVFQLWNIFLIERSIP